MRAMAAAIMAALLGAAASAQPGAPGGGATPPADYAVASNWICRPGAGAQGTADGTCAADLDAMAVTATGARTRAPFVAAVAPPIDCFYVYPTASDDESDYSDLAVDASEKHVVHGQAARLSSVCRLFVPAYHQVTLPALRRNLAGARDTIADINTLPYRDIRDAWRSYLARDNHGRGVVLVGHSQGAILLKRLIAEEIDGKPAQARLVGAYLAGNPNLGSASFRMIHPCRAPGETGCLVAWSTFMEDYAGKRAFGGTRDGAPICVNPALPGGGRGALKPDLPRPGMAPESDPPWVQPVGQLTAECVADADGAVLRVRIEPGRYADLLRASLGGIAAMPSWGLHVLDINLAQGNMLDMIAGQGAAWMRARR